MPPGQKGGDIITPERYKEHKQHTFDSFCKKVLKYEAYNSYREIGRRQAHEITFSELPEEAMNQLAIHDTYPWERTPFQIDGSVVLIKDDQLAAALNVLPQEDRDILLMYWFLDMTDNEIAIQKSMLRRTVNYRRLKSYRLLKELMGGDSDD